MRTAAALAVAAAFVWLAFRTKGYTVQFKDGVLLALSPTMSSALPIIDRVSLELLDRGAIITSATDGRHSAGSKHYTGNAVDLRTRDLTRAKVDAYGLRLDNALNAARHVYDVLIEDDHIHIEVDPKVTRLGPLRI